MEKLTIAQMMADFDWKAVFSYATASGYDGPGKVTAVPGAACSNAFFEMDDVAEVYDSADGENDEASWLCVGRLKDGRFFYVTAGCDYTGWGCQSGGEAFVADTADQLYALGFDQDARSRLGWRP